MGNRFETGFIKNQKSLVAKLGTDSWLREGQIDTGLVTNWAEQVWQVRDLGRPLALVVSGEKALGGQDRLTAAWRSKLAPHGIVTRQVLFGENTYDQNLLEVRHALDDGVVPIINGDPRNAGEKTRNNDHLATGIALYLGADTAYLTGEKGVLNPDRQVIRRLTKDTGVVYWGQSNNGTGGMEEKVGAAWTVVDAGHEALIASASQENVLVDFAERVKEMEGTRIAA